MEGCGGVEGWVGEGMGGMEDVVEWRDGVEWRMGRSGGGMGGKDLQLPFKSLNSFSHRH